MIVETDYSFGASLRMMRMSRGLTQTALAAESGISQSKISNWELGYHRPDIDDLRRLCVTLKCFPGDLLGIRSAELSVREFNFLNGLRELSEDGWFVMEGNLDIQRKLHSRLDG